MSFESDIVGLEMTLVEDLVGRALAEDAPWGDITSDTLLPADATIAAELVAREDGVLSGAVFFATALRLADADTQVAFLARDGESFSAGAVLAKVAGCARAVLRAERVALNFVQRMSGIATQTAHFVRAVAGTRARIADTRKTTPGLRLVERYAVRCGGGHNHRFSLSDALLAKDNHLAVLTQNGKRDLGEALREVRGRLPHTMHMEVEVDRLEQIAGALDGGANTILLDNFSITDLRAGVQQIAGRALVEASGSIRLETVAAIAAAGVDIISVGALTHSVRALDMGLDVQVRDGK